jgi:hypothetical protein
MPTHWHPHAAFIAFSGDYGMREKNDALCTLGDGGVGGNTIANVNANAIANANAKADAQKIISSHGSAAATTATAATATAFKNKIHTRREKKEKSKNKKRGGWQQPEQKQQRGDDGEQAEDRNNENEDRLNEHQHMISWTQFMSKSFAHEYDITFMDTFRMYASRGDLHTRSGDCIHICYSYETYRPLYDMIYRSIVYDLKKKKLPRLH